MAETIKQNQPQLSMNLDTTPILYTDNIAIITNKMGIVWNIVQQVGSSNAARIVARIGMSREYAKKFNQELGKLLVITQTEVTLRKRGSN
jgi:hypothetical protein